MKAIIYGGRFLGALGTTWRECAILVSNDRIEAMGPLSEMIRRVPDVRGIDVKGRTVLPRRHRKRQKSGGGGS
jgi:predicted amidohydrolase YtcJ